MSGEVIVAALLMIASVVGVSMMINAVYPSIGDVAGAVSSSTNIASERMQTDIKIISVVNKSNNVYVWVKNTGSKATASSLIERTDMFFGPTSSFQFMSYNSSPGWNYTIVNGDGDADWDPNETIQIIINSTTSTGVYYVKVILYNGASDEDYFSL